MRTIKFRAWDKEEKKMLSFEDIQDYTLENLQSDEIWEVMQFTGLLDKDGKEIYEGDILEIKNKKAEVAWAEGDILEIKNKKAEVAWADGGFYFENNGLDFDQYDWVDDAYRMEIIGNIYKNPELLAKRVIKNMEYEITNDFGLDAIKDNFKPPKMGEIKEDELIELFERLQINLQFFYDYVHKNSEYYTYKDKNAYLISDVAKVIRHLFNIEDLNENNSR